MYSSIFSGLSRWFCRPKNTRVRFAVGSPIIFCRVWPVNLARTRSTQRSSFGYSTISTDGCFITRRITTRITLVTQWFSMICSSVFQMPILAGNMEGFHILGSLFLITRFCSLTTRITCALGDLPAIGPLVYLRSCILFDIVFLIGLFGEFQLVAISGQLTTFITGRFCGTSRITIFGKGRPTGQF